MWKYLILLNHTLNRPTMANFMLDILIMIKKIHINKMMIKFFDTEPIEK